MSAPFIPPAVQAAIQILIGRGHTVTVRTNREGNVRYRIDGGRETVALTLLRKCDRLPDYTAMMTALRAEESMMAAEIRAMDKSTYSIARDPYWGADEMYELSTIAARNWAVTDEALRRAETRIKELERLPLDGSCPPAT